MWQEAHVRWTVGPGTLTEHTPAGNCRSGLAARPGRFSPRWPQRRVGAACHLSRGNLHSFLHGQQCRVCTRGPRGLTDEVGGVGGTEEVRQVQPSDQGRVHGDSLAPAPRVVCGKRVLITHHPNPSPASPGVTWTPTPTRRLQSTQDQQAQFSRTCAPGASGWGGVHGQVGGAQPHVWATVGVDPNEASLCTWQNG